MPTPDPTDSGSTRIRRRFDFASYLRTETVGGVILLAAAVLAVVLANSPLSGLYEAVREFRIGPASAHLDLTVGDWAKDGLLAIFFFVAGLELKRELVVGELADRRTATLPVLAALGGMIVPGVLAYSLAYGAPGAEQAWSIPVATDIAFALGVLALTGSGLPSTARVFLLSLAVVDDLGAILVIAVVFTSSLNAVALVAAVALGAAYWYAQHKRIRTAWLYVPLAVAVWAMTHSSGLHPTIAGVALGLLTRVRRDPSEDEPVSVRLEHRLQPWSAGLIVPLFALFAAGVPFDGEALGALLHDRIAISVMAGLVLGKFVGIFGTSYLAVALGIGSRPSGIGWRELAGLSMLGGVGFTVSLLMAELSLQGTASEHAKAAVLIASTLAALLASAMLVRAKRTGRSSSARITHR